MCVFSHYVNYRFSDLLFNRLCTTTTIYVLSVTHPHEFCLTSACQYGKSLFFFFVSTFERRALNHDEMLRGALNYSISKHGQIFARSDTILNRFAVRFS